MSIAEIQLEHVSDPGSINVITDQGILKVILRYK